MSVLTTTSITAAERPQETDPDIWHIVCHCTNDNIAACRRDYTEDPWVASEQPVCSLCMLAWPDDAPTCPWGCACDDECGPEVSA